MGIKHCGTCKHAKVPLCAEPCASCDKDEFGKWTANDTTEKSLEQIANQMAVANAINAHRAGLLSRCDVETLLDMIASK